MPWWAHLCGTADISLGLLIVTGVIAITRIAIRLYKRMLWWDDYFAAISLACFTAFVPGELIFS